MTATAGLASYVNQPKGRGDDEFISRRQPFLPCYTDSSANGCCISNGLRVAEAVSTNKNVRAPASFYYLLGNRKQMPPPALIDRQGLSFSGHVLTFGDRTFNMPHKILDAGRFDSGIAVVLDYMELEKPRRSENLWGVDLNGNCLWIAEAPDSAASAYVSLVSTQPLRAWNFACFVCTLDPSSGRLIEAEFTK